MVGKYPTVNSIAGPGQNSVYILGIEDMTFPTGANALILKSSKASAARVYSPTNLPSSASPPRSIW